MFRRYHGVVIVTVIEVLLDVLQLLRAALHSHQRRAAENLFLRNNWPCPSNAKRSPAAPPTPRG
jgi:hypothetical protein